MERKLFNFNSRLEEKYKEIFKKFVETSLPVPIADGETCTSISHVYNQIDSFKAFLKNHDFGAILKQFENDVAKRDWSLVRKFIHNLNFRACFLPNFKPQFHDNCNLRRMYYGTDSILINCHDFYRYCETKLCLEPIKPTDFPLDFKFLKFRLDIFSIYQLANMPVTFDL
jgi:hypothetical protein